MATENDDSIEAIEEIAGKLDEVEEAPKQDSEVAKEECLHTIATLALELEAGKREAITAEDIRITFAAHDVTELYEEAKLFFDDKEEDSDLGSEGPGEDEDDEDEDDEDPPDDPDPSDDDEDEDEDEDEEG